MDVFNSMAGLTKKNHFARSAACDSMATDEGSVTSNLMKNLTDGAKA